MSLITFAAIITAVYVKVTGDRWLLRQPTTRTVLVATTILATDAIAFLPLAR